MIFLKTFNGDSNVKFSVNGTFFETFKIIWLRSSRFAIATPMTIGRWDICGWDARVASASPEPTIYIDGLQVFSIAAFAFEVALAARSVNGANVICKIGKLCQKMCVTYFSRKTIITEQPREAGKNSNDDCYWMTLTKPRAWENRYACIQTLPYTFS